MVASAANVTSASGWLQPIPQAAAIANVVVALPSLAASAIYCLIYPPPSILLYYISVFLKVAVEKKALLQF